MSSLLLPLGLIAMFGSILLTGGVVESLLAQRRRAVDVLACQLTPPASTTERRQVELQLRVLQRVLIPFVSGLGSVARRTTPADMRRRIARKLVLAGSPA